MRYLFRDTTPCFVVPLGEALSKAGPYIGPRGGKWADVKHTIPWKKAAEKKVTTRRNWIDHTPGLPKQTVDAYKNPDGTYKAERKKVHQEIIDTFLKGIKHPPKDTKKVAIVMMGGPASGKTTLVKKFAGERFGDFANVNPDDVKESLPEYNKALSFKYQGVASSAKDAAAMVHAESSDIASEVYNRAIEKGLNIVLDGTGRNADRHTVRIEELRAAGYHVQLLMPDIDMEEAVRRSKDRSEATGRYVPAGPPPPGTPDIIRDVHKFIPSNFERIARSADEFALYDSRSRIPMVKWSGGRGMEDKIHDAAFVEGFKKRAGVSGVQTMAKSQPSNKKGKRPHLTVEDVEKRIKDAPEGLGREDEKLPKRFDKNTGVVQVVEDVDYTGRRRLKYK